jgi:excinuclease ABC subunit B
MDADKEGFLRNERSLTQTAGRAARNADGLVIFYADKITGSMQRTIDETKRRRDKQMAFNEANGIVPTTVRKTIDQVMAQGSVLDVRGYDPSSHYAKQAEVQSMQLVAEEDAEYKTIPQLEKGIKSVKKQMEKAAKDYDFMEAARLRDLMFDLQKRLDEFKKSE